MGPRVSNRELIVFSSKNEIAPSGPRKLFFFWNRLKGTWERMVQIAQIEKIMTSERMGKALFFTRVIS